MDIQLTEKDLRALRLTEKQNAAEVKGHELQSLKTSLILGFVEPTPWSDVHANGRIWQQRVLRITPKGIAFLKEKTKS